MRGNDISNYVEPRILMVFEGLIGDLPKENELKLKLMLKAHRWQSAVQCYELNEMTVNIINDIVWRKHYNVDVVTWQPPKFADALADYLDEQGVFAGRVTSDNSIRLARSLPHRPDVAYVCDPDPNHSLRYGAKGRYVDDSSHDWFGSL